MKGVLGMSTPLIVRWQTSGHDTRPSARLTVGTMNKLGEMYVRLGEDAAYCDAFVSGGERLSALLREAQKRLWYHLAQETRDELGVPENPNR